jgi:hypothetical protein
MALGWAIGLSVASTAAGIFGSANSASAQNAAVDKQYNYDLQSWKYSKDRLRADHRQNVEQWRYNVQNEETLGAFKDATNLQDWNYQLKIQQAEYGQQLKQYAKSEQIYNQQLTFNQLAQSAAVEAEYRKLEDATNELALQNQDIVIKALQTQGKSAVVGQVGRSADKAEQAEFASFGRNQAILAQSLISAQADARGALKKIANDKFGADLAAEANRMLAPDRLPTPPKPLTTPRAQYLKPRKLTKADFGPKPIKGAKASMTAGILNQASQGLGSIAGFVGAKIGP